MNKNITSNTDIVVMNDDVSSTNNKTRASNRTNVKGSAATTTWSSTFSLSEHRFINVGRTAVVVCDETTRKFVNLSLQRWAKLRELMPDIDDAVKGVVKKRSDVFYRRHLGAGWFVTVKSGIRCVDIRKHFNVSTPLPPRPSHVHGGEDDDEDDVLVIDNAGDDDESATVEVDANADGDNDVGIHLQPTRVGLGLRIREWRVLKEITSIVDSIRPDIADTQPCYLNNDHLGQEGKTQLLTIR